ncbi:uncharacterized protein LOC144350473 [Saccoglossus kowalevskii]
MLTERKKSGLRRTNKVYPFPSEENPLPVESRADESEFVNNDTAKDDDEKNDSIEETEAGDIKEEEEEATVPEGSVIESQEDEEDILTCTPIKVIPQRFGFVDAPRKARVAWGIDIGDHGNDQNNQSHV